MPNLVVDIGNTRVKSALFEKGEITWERAFENLDFAKKAWSELSFEESIISSVKWSEEELKSALDFDFLFLTRETSLPIYNGYGSPQTLGLDRIAAAIGGWKKAGQNSALVIDLGSCMTFELIVSDTYKGGAISPGLAMRAKAMNQFTARLPLVEVGKKPESRVGDSTQTCMQVGVWYGIYYEIIGQIQAFRAEFPEIKVFVCGGDAQSFESLAKDHIFVVPNLVLYGLNCILNHNVE
ncbi:MAG TPA: type III pantothenate kinase [Algoriphagus sp.]|jgi:type III pantothenate kinase|uniref:type III pantothenate kinase n=1 Tax=unclassified Algoriphagus TaxID=2641541 RepID=UPI000C4F82C2|nr:MULTISPECIES: type III pantothenate kinase [unclassified Algoriphagus]MAL15432.1 type III pantothenate kinase [Algoriphagus sp.]QYH40378.1 type III pantothenate kinase [Algoriphagus sp. NBT04N3]HAH35499.1 type III pantothenate kinase [Algoriphagus sp.]HAS59567.1 type III pantothenate kinase [Algoriphagus sp.]HAZ23732.1 type III pantothenate kinase [Algoriphagus sp.]|tara:strand:+ start:1014 stop:1727 length:714 start_codon:yes stop_codon:yes gene_type:complete